MSNRFWGQKRNNFFRFVTLVYVAYVSVACGGRTETDGTRNNAQGGESTTSMTVAEGASAALGGAGGDAASVWDTGANASTTLGGTGGGASSALGGAPISQGGTHMSGSSLIAIGTTLSTQGGSDAGIVDQLSTCDPTFLLGGLHTFGTGESPYSITVGDFNRDGNQDLATANQGDDTVSVLLGKGNGDFEPKRDFAIGKTPQAIACGDLDGDGDTDIVTMNQNTDDLTLLLGNGHGAFELGASYATTKDPCALAVGNLNDDPYADVVTTDWSSNTVNVYLGSAAGITSRVDYTTGDYPNSLAIGDVNIDGMQDIVVVDHYSHGASVLLGKGDGTFLDKISSSGTSAYYPASVAIGDFSGDGKPDLGLGDPQSRGGGGELNVMLGAGDGTFAAGVNYPGFDVKGLVSADLNGDGTGDLIALGANTMSVILGPQSGTLPAPQSYVPGGTCGGAVIGDFNRDNKGDLACTLPNANWLRMYLGQGNGAFAAASVVTQASSITAFVLGDLNRDGKQDLVTSTYPRALNVMFGDGKGNFDGSSAVQYTVSDSASSLVVGDLNSDGALDIAASTSISRRLTVLFNAGDGTFPRSSQLELKDYPMIVKIIDLSGDAKSDLAVLESSGKVGVLLGNGDGTFGSEQQYAASYAPQAPAFAIDDVNNDGHPDIVAPSTSNSALSVQLGLGDGTFKAPTVVTMDGNGPMGTGDLDEDGFVDLVTTDSSSGRITVHLGHGDGGFDTDMAYQAWAGRSPEQVELIDINRDGHLDILAVDAGTALAVLLGVGDGSFGCSEVFDLSGSTGRVLLRDINEDGRSDLIEATPKGIGVLLNTPR